MTDTEIIDFINGNKDCLNQLTIFNDEFYWFHNNKRFYSEDIRVAISKKKENKENQTLNANAPQVGD